MRVDPGQAEVGEHSPHSVGDHHARSCAALGQSSGTCHHAAEGGGTGNVLVWNVVAVQELQALRGVDGEREEQRHGQPGVSHQQVANAPIVRQLLVVFSARVACVCGGVRACAALVMYLHDDTDAALGRVTCAIDIGHVRMQPRRLAARWRQTCGE